MIFETERLYTKPWNDNDLAYARKLWGDPKVMKLISSEPSLEDEQIKNRLREQMKTQQDFNVQYWALCKKDTKEIIGCCGFRPYNVAEKVYEIGFHIMSDHWGKGYATEAALGAVEFAKRTAWIKKLFAGHNPNNHVLGKVLGKLGFTYIRDEFYEPTGLMHPSYEMDVGGN